MSGSDQPAYLQPYARAVKRHGPDFRALLWASRRTQELRFDALAKLANPTGLSVLDVGCGRADLLDFFISRDMLPPTTTIFPRRDVEASSKRFTFAGLMRALRGR